MTVRELIGELRCCDPEAKVMIAYNYGDHARSIVAEEVECVGEERVCWSDYHSQPKVLGEDEESDGKTVEYAIVLQG